MTKKIILLGCVLSCLMFVFGCTSSKDVFVSEAEKVNESKPLQTTKIEERVDEGAYVLINAFTTAFLSINQVTEAKKISDEECKKVNMVCGYADEAYTYYFDKDYKYIKMITKNDDSYIKTVRERIIDEDAAKLYADSIIFYCNNEFIGENYDTYAGIKTSNGDRIYCVEVLSKDEKGAHTGNMVSVEFSHDGIINSLNTYTDKKSPTVTRSAK